jgi:hypothetical protein
MEEPRTPDQEAQFVAAVKRGVASAESGDFVEHE